MKFIDETKILVIAGAGGRGCVSFRREKFVPRGGPNGGNGGNGGDVVAVADPQMTTLLDLRYQKQYKAGRGEHGMGKDCHGRRGEDRNIRVPVGAIIRDAATGEIVGQGRAKKILVFKKKRRKSYSRQRGHRQYQTTLKITGIEA